MRSGCGVDYEEAIRDAVYNEIDNVRNPFASPRTLWRMKQTMREKDAMGSPLGSLFHQRIARLELWKR